MPETSRGNPLPSTVSNVSIPAAGGSAGAAPKMKFVNQAAISVISQAATQIVVIGTMLIMPRIMPAAVKGPAELVTMLATFLIVFSNMGLSTAILYHPDRANISIDRMASTALTAGICVSGVVAGICSFFFPNYFATGHGTIVEPWHVILVLATCPLQLSTSYLNATQVVAGNIIGFNFIQFLPTAVFVSTFFGIYLWQGAEFFERNPHWFLSGIVIAHVARWTISAVVAVFLLRKAGPFRAMIDFSYLKKALSFGARPYLRDVFQCCTFYATPYYLDWEGFSGTEIGYFTLAVSAMVAVWQLPEAIHMILANRMATQSARDRHWFTPIVCRNVIFVSFCAALFVGIVAEVFVSFWWPNYVGAIPTIRVMLAGAVLFTLFKVLQTDLLARGEINLVPILSGVTFVLLASLNIFAISVLGLRNITVSAACGAIAMSLVGIYTLIHYARVSRNPLPIVLFIQKDDIRLWRDFFNKILKRK
ncbi:MAG: lipopolysaccharide biosynthesis protein [Planctomycetota bacterium]